MSDEKKRDYWFPAKRYGWGWGVPCTWQGWAVMATYAVLMTFGLLFQTQLGPLVFVVYVATLSVGLVSVCWLKGEPPRWRWGAE